jgi:hypothetical protein
LGGKFLFFGVFFPSFISSCGLGGMRPRAAIRRLVSAMLDDLAMTQRPTPIPPFQPRERKLAACLHYAHHNWNLHRNPKSSDLAQVANFFRGRCARLRALMLMPATVGDLTIQMQRALNLAEFEITGKVDKDGNFGPQADKVESRWHELLIEFGQKTQQLRQTPGWDNHVLTSLKAGLKASELMVADTVAARAFEASLMSYLTTTWTIIENMSGDLWEAAVNAHPATLANLNGKPNRLRKTKDLNKANSSANKESKTVQLDLISMHGFDIHGKMGTLLRERFEFSRLEGIREAYCSAFDKDAVQIDRALSNTALDSLSAVRNVIVHKDGQADADYAKKAKFLKDIPQAQPGQHVWLDGEIVVGLMKPAIIAANQLLIAVDEWLLKHQS